MDRAKISLDSPPAVSPPVRLSLAGRQYACVVKHAEIEFYDETNGNTKYEADIDGFLPLLSPKLTKAGKVAVHQPHIPKQSAKWVESAMRISWFARRWGLT